MHTHRSSKKYNKTSFPIRNLKDHPWNMYAPREKEGVKAKAYIYCFSDVILLFKSVQGQHCLKITKSEGTYLLDGPLHFLSDSPAYVHCIQMFLHEKKLGHATRHLWAQHLVHFQLKPLCCYFSLLFLTKWKNLDARRSCIKILC